MKISLDKQLEKRSQEEKKKYDVSHFNETKLLTNQEDNEDARILRGLSNVSQFNRIDEIKGVNSFITSENQLHRLIQHESNNREIENNNIILKSQKKILVYLKNYLCI